VQPLLHRTCEERPAGIQRASSLEAAHRSPIPQATTRTPRTPRSPLLGGSLLGPAASSITRTLVPKAQRVCDSPRFIRLDFTIGSILGAGRFASVRRGVERQSGEAVAIKILHRTDPCFELGAVRAEIAAMRAVKNEEHCCRLLAVYEDWESIYLVQELAAGGSLARRIKAGARFREAEAALIVAQVLKALAALHREGIAHRDVKFDNILMVSDDPTSVEYNRAVICDFGLCKHLDGPSRMCGTKQFWAPELVTAASGTRPGDPLPEANYDVKVDVWAAGFVLYTLLFGKEPFKNQNEDAMYAEIRRGATIPTDAGVSPGAHDLVSRLLSVDPRERPTADAALCHSWLAEQCHGRSSCLLLDPRDAPEPSFDVQCHTHSHDSLPHWSRGMEFPIAA
jgi:serine/threonine protein kinase